MQKIIPHLWFDKEAQQAAEFYTSIFPDSKIVSSATLHDTPSGDAQSIVFDLSGYRFMAISAGPFFKANPSISFMLNFDPSTDPRAREHLDALWEKLSDGGTALMPLDKYPFSDHYGWIQDKFGISWQLILTKPEGEPRPFIIPSLLFVTDTCEAAEDATNFYIETFKNAKRGQIARYPAGMEPNKEGSIMFTDFMLENQWFTAMDTSSKMHSFAFNEGISLLVMCENQEEIDYYWDKLSAVPEAEQCGWLKDKYGLSWQITPKEMQEMMSNGTPEQIAKVTQAFLKMKKFDINTLNEAYNA